MKEFSKVDRTKNPKCKPMYDKLIMKWWSFKRSIERVWNNFFEIEESPYTFREIMKIIFFSLIAAPLIIELFRIILLIGILFTE